MVVAGTRVSGVADVSNHLSLPHEIAFGETIGVMRKVRVVIDELLVRAELIDGRAAAIAMKEFQNLPICCGKHGSFSGRGNIDRVVHASFGTRFVERIDQLLGFNSGDGNDEVHSADKV